jgi:hypothetical protein
MATLPVLVQGAIAMACAVASLCFYRFWGQTRDRFFLFFAVSFAIAAVERVALGLSRTTVEGEPLFYVLRLVTHALIIVAIVDKNRRRRG